MSRPFYWIAGLFFAALVLTKFSPQTGFTSLIRFGGKWQDRRPGLLQTLPIHTVPGSSGYDGQFYAEIALDPLLRSPELDLVIDAPAYRARRILAPATATMLGFGSPWRTLQAYALLNVLCWFVLGWLLYRDLCGSDWSGFARWVGCMFSLGVMDSVRQSLVDLPALVFLVLAVNAQMRSQMSNSTFWLALGNLTKETSLLSALVLHCNKPWAEIRWKCTLLHLLIATLPLALWSLYVHQRFGGIPGSAGLGNFDWPFLALLAQIKLSLQQVFNGNFDGRYSFSLLALAGFFVQGGVIWRTPQFQSPWWRVGAVYSILFLFLSSWVWSGYWAICRAVLPLTIAYNLLLPARRWFWPLWMLGNITLLHGVWRFL